MAIPSITRPYKDWLRLANTIRDRRNELGLTQDQCVEMSRGAISRPSWSGLESPHRDKLSKSVRSLNACARVLGWTYDSCELILAGQEPLIRRSEDAEVAFRAWATEQTQRGTLATQEEAAGRLVEIEARMSALELALQQLADAVRDGRPDGDVRPRGPVSAAPRRQAGRTKS